MPCHLLQVMYNHELTHGAFLLDYEVKQAIVTEMRGLLARSGSAVVGLARPVLARTLTLMTNGFGESLGRVSMKKGGGNGRCVVLQSPGDAAGGSLSHKHCQQVT